MKAQYHQKAKEKKIKEALDLIINEVFKPFWKRLYPK
jgi:hypothetical protein